MATTRTSHNARIEAWIVGTHQLPQDDVPPSVVDRARFGDVIVRTGDQWDVMTRDDFDRDYEWA